MKVILPAALAASCLLLTVNSVFAADLSPAIVGDRAAELRDWSGAYVGASVGYGKGVADRQFADLPFTYAEDDLSGMLGGVQTGYNIQISNLLLGIEGNIDWAALSTSGAPDALPRDINWMAGVVGRVGFVSDRVAVYGMAGLVAADTTVESFLGEGATAVETGWTVGVGIEAMLTGNMSVKLEYAHSSFETDRYDFTDPAPFSINSGFATDIVRAGANFHF